MVISAFSALSDFCKMSLSVADRSSIGSKSFTKARNSVCGCERWRSIHRQARSDIGIASREVAAGRHLADQLLLPMALAGGGEFTTLPVSAHFNSHAAIIEMFLGRRTSVKSDAGFMHVTV
jgi:hypothetical protein